MPSVSPAKQTRLFSGSFGEAGSSPPNPYPLSEAGSIAVDSASHDVYVADEGNHRVEKFAPSGDFLFMLGLEVNKTAVEESATRKTEENVCPAPGHPADICQAGTPGAGVGAFLHPGYLAVDNSTSSSKGDLYVANTGEVDEVQRVTVTATGGTFTLGYEGETTAPIAFNAPPAVFQPGSISEALDARPKMSVGIDTNGAPGHFTLEFLGPSVSGRDVPLFVCDGAALTGPGAGCAVEVERRGFSATVVEKFDSSGQPIASWGEGGELSASSVTGPPAPVTGPFGQLQGVAVDTSGNLWVSEQRHNVFEFASDASFLAGWSGESGELAVDANDNLYFSSGQGGDIRKYNAIGDEVGVVAPSSTEFLDDNFGGGREAVDPATDSLYVAGREGFSQAGTNHGIVKRYDLSTCVPVITHELPEPGCAPAESFGAGLIDPESPHAVAVDQSTDALYVGDRGHVTSFSFLTVPDAISAKPTDLTAGSATLTATINPGGVELNAGLTGCRFEWGETPAPYEHTVACDKSAGQIGAGSEPVEVAAAISGLQAGRTYHYRIVASNANDVNANVAEPSLGADASFGPPLLESASALDVTATSATIQAQVNPNDVETRVRVEYGDVAGDYAHAAAVLDIGSAGTVQAPTFELAGLTAGSVYHYRVVAENALGEGAEAVGSVDHTFTTETASAFALPDGRGWELVSPPAKHGAIIQAPSGLVPIQASATGNAIAFTTSSPTESNGAGNPGDVEIVSARSAAGWSSEDVATPNAVVHGATEPEYRYFSPDLSLGIVEPTSSFSPEISFEASEQTPYLRTDFSPDGELCRSSCYRPLVTGAPGFANVPPGTKFGKEQVKGEAKAMPGVEFLGASPDARNIVLRSMAPLVEGASPNGLYKWSEGRLELISVPPAEEPNPAMTGLDLGSPSHEQGAVSLDGTRVIWSEGESNGGRGGHLYLRDVRAEQTLRIDVNQGGTGKGPGRPALFQWASADASVILFTDEQQLTPNSGAAPDRPDLYRCQVIVGEAGELECVLTDLTPAAGAENSGFQGMLGASEDGSSVYFVANGVLAHNQVDHGAGREEATAGGCGNTALEERGSPTCNLYEYRDGTTNFIARLSSTDRYDFGLGGPVRVSSSGRWLALMSQRSLTGYDNRDISSDKSVAEVYLYEARTGTMLCASCDPRGVRPHGEEYNQLASPRGLNDLGTWNTRLLVSGFLPASIKLEQSSISPYESRALSDTGRLFFNSVDRLVPQDSNGTEDVYEFEPPAVGTCSEATATFVPRNGGCVALISSGATQRESVFLDASENGDDVFFLTAAKLSPLDPDSAYDVYDARVNGGDREPAKPVECQGDSCQGFVVPPNDATPDSLTYSGPGNLKPLPPPLSSRAKPGKCPKGKKLERHACVKVRESSKRKRHAHRPVSRRRAK
jgi:hypothetical protein